MSYEEYDEEYEEDCEEDECDNENECDDDDECEDDLTELDAALDAVTTTSQGVIDDYLRTIDFKTIFSQEDLQTFEKFKSEYLTSYNCLMKWNTIYKARSIDLDKLNNISKDTDESLLVPSLSRLFPTDLNVEQAVANLNVEYMEVLLDYICTKYKLDSIYYKAAVTKCYREPTTDFLYYEDIILDYLTMLPKDSLTEQALSYILLDVSKLLKDDLIGKPNYSLRGNQVTVKLNVVGTHLGEQVIKVDRLIPFFRAIHFYMNQEIISRQYAKDRYVTALASQVGESLDFSQQGLAIVARITNSGNLVLDFAFGFSASDFISKWFLSEQVEANNAIRESEYFCKVKVYSRMFPHDDIIIQTQDSSGNLVTTPKNYWEDYFYNDLHPYKKKPYNVCAA